MLAIARLGAVLVPLGTRRKMPEISHIFEDAAPVAVIHAVGSDTIDEAMVRAFCAERMADYKVPGRVVIGKTPLPRNANGKIQKAELREAARSGSK